MSKKRNTGISVEENSRLYRSNTFFKASVIFFFSVVVRSHLFDIRVMRVCLKAKEKSVAYYINIEIACVGETKMYFWSESFFILFVYFNVFAIKFAWRYCAEVCNELHGVFWRHGFRVTQPE